ncbi:MAG: hypothetical protein ACM3QZ_03575 [Solirubrobacterales bacterium]
MNRKIDESSNVLGDSITRNFQVLSSLNEKFWDMWMVNIGSLSWMNEQWENMVQTYVGQRKAIREELVKVAEQMSEQIQKNLSQVEDTLKDAWVASADNVNIPSSIPGYKSYADLVKQVDELSKKVVPNK